MAKNFHSVCIGTLYSSAASDVYKRQLGVLREVLLDLRIMRLVTERERFKVVVQAEIVVGVGRFSLKLLDEPHVTICREE